MEIKIRNAFVIKNEFLVAVERLLQSRSMPAKTCIEVNRLIDELFTHLEILKKSRRDITLRYCSKDEHGSAKLDSTKSVVFPSDADKAACASKLMELDQEYFTAELTSPVVIYSDEDITPLELRMLGHIVQVKERN
jgi:hypothetical protein